MPSSGKSPVIATPLPRPHNAFSLKVGVGARDSDSYDTSRTEFEPMSTIATGSPGNRPRALSGVAGRVGTVSSITNPAGRLGSAREGVYQRRRRSAIGKDSTSALPRPERLGLVMK